VPAAAARSLSTAVELWDEAGVAPPVVALLPLAEALALVGDTAAAEVALGRARPRAVTAAERADVANFASWVAALEGQPDRERVLLAEALPLAEEAGGPCLIRTLIGLVWSESNSGELSAAEEHAARALTLAEELDDLTEMCRALGASALVVAEQGDLEASQRCVERQLAVAVVAGNLDAQARALDNLGVVIHLRGDAEGDDDLYREAIRNYRRGIEIHDRLGERQMSLMMTLNMAQAHVRLGLDDDARLLISDVAAAAIDLRSELVQCLCLVGEADRLISRGQVAVGLAYLGLHLRQRSAGSIDQHEADRVLARASLSRDVIEAGMAAGADLDLETVVRLLAGGGESRR
jgi:tetratricopeptide (TPR) repeat protein